MKKALLLSFLVSSIFNAFGQQNSTLSYGVLIDDEDNEIISANIQFFKKGAISGGTISNLYGEFSFPRQKVDSLYITYVGSKPIGLNRESFKSEHLIVLEKGIELLPATIIGFKPKAKCILTNINSCPFGNDAITSDTSFSKPLIQNNQWFLYPNPTQDIVNINIPKNAQGNIPLYNNLGQFVSTLPIHSNIETIDLSSYPAGTYHLRYQNEQWVESIGQVIKVKP